MLEVLIPAKVPEQINSRRTRTISEDNLFNHRFLSTALSSTSLGANKQVGTKHKISTTCFIIPYEKACTVKIEVDFVQESGMKRPF